MPSSTAKPMIMKPLASLMRITLVIAVSCVLPKLLPSRSVYDTWAVDEPEVETRMVKVT